jgi:predicted O-methyltransferase YrrM
METRRQAVPAAPAVPRLAELYRTHADRLAVVRDEQRALLRSRPGMRAQLDDVEAELTYLLLREARPAVVVEIGALHGWSTSWILRALRDNGAGRLYSYDRITNARDNLPAELTDGRWTFTGGDARDTAVGMPLADTGYLFVDAAHSARFARWYLAELFPRVGSGVPVSVHDVFHGRWAKPFSEGSVLLRYLADRGVGYLTASAARDRQVAERLWAVRRDLGLTEPVHSGRDNPMVFFTLR